MAEMDFGLAAVTNTLSKQNDLMRQRQGEELANQAREKVAAEEKARIAQSASRISQDLVDSLGMLTQTIDKAEKGAQETEALKSSGNPLDALDLIGKQIRDPSTYTKAGRQKALNEAQQLTNARTQVATIQQAALADLSASVDASLAAAGSGLESAKLAEQQNQELINAEIARVQTQGQTLLANRQLMEQKLAMMSEEETRAAYQKSGGKPIDVGGVMIAPGDLEQRIAALDERKYAAETRAAASELKNVQLAERAAQRELESMNIEELRPMLLNGDPRFKLESIKQVYETKMQAQSAEFSKLGLEFQYADFGASVTVPAMQEAERMAPAIPANTPLAAALDSYRKTIGTVMATADQVTSKGIPLPVEARVAGANAIAEEKKKLDAAIEKEATLRSNGNKELKQIYSELYRGNPAPRDVVETYITERLDKNEPLTAVLPPEVATEVTQRFNSLYSQSIKEGMMLPGFDKKQAKAEAIQRAIADGVGAKITERTDDLVVGQVMDPSSPLYGTMNPNQFRGLVAKADAEGMREFRQKYDLSDEEFARFAAGQTIEGKIGPEAAAELGIIQTQALFLQLDAMESGLAKKYANWWAGQGQSYIGQTMQRRQQEAVAAGPQAMTMESFATPIEARQIGAQMQVISDAESTYGNAKEKRYNEMISFDLNPSHRQATLLQFNKDLNDDEKKTFMKGFVLPLVKQAQDQGFTFEQTNTLIENAIDEGQVQDPTLAKILKKVAKDRVATVELMEGAMVNPHWRVAPGEPRMGFQPYAWLRRTTAQRKYDWYREALGE